MSQVELVVSVDPLFFGATATTENVEAFAFDLNKNIEKRFDVKCDYTVRKEGNGYSIKSPKKPALELNFSVYFGEIYLCSNFSVI